VADDQTEGKPGQRGALVRLAVVRADQREEKAAWMPPPADEGGPEA
jgi:hypothetical protein